MGLSAVEATAAAVLLAAGILLILPAAHACSEPAGGSRELTLVERAHDADSILVGKIIGRFDDENFNYGSGSTVYTAVMKVYCIYKGPNREGIVNITHVGRVAGLCHMTNLTSGQEYVVFVDGPDNRIKGVEVENTAAGRLGVSRACGLSLNFPTGITAEDLPHECPAPATEPDCVAPSKDRSSDQMPPPPPSSARSQAQLRASYNIAVILLCVIACL